MWGDRKNKHDRRNEISLLTQFLCLCISTHSSFNMAPSNLFTTAAVALFFVLQLSSSPVVVAQDACSGITACGECLDSSCNWWAPALSCISTCGIIAETSCYSLTDGEASDVTCERAANSDADLVLCDDFTDCSSCTGQVLSDGVSKCQWFPPSDGTASYCSSRCDGDDCGLAECPPCSANDSCGSCLFSACAWAAEAGCVDSCDQVADVACFTTDSVVASTARASDVQDICLIADTQQADASLCSAVSECTSCVGTILSDGTTSCQWFDMMGSSYCASACGMDGCGVSTCPAETDAPAVEEQTEPPIAAATGSASLIVTGLVLGYSSLVFLF
jgi:uncharacterized protein YodC (DUF2158 family)